MLMGMTMKAINTNLNTVQKSKINRREEQWSGMVFSKKDVENMIDMSGGIECFTDGD